MKGALIRTVMDSGAETNRVVPVTGNSPSAQRQQSVTHIVPVTRFLTAVLLLISLAFCSIPVTAAEYETDVFPTVAGDIVVTFLGHGSYGIRFGGLVTYIDPWSEQADYAALPKADIVFITHDHMDHLDQAALTPVVTDATDIVLPTRSDGKYTGNGQRHVIGYGDSLTVRGIRVDVVPAYNLTYLMDPNSTHRVHPKGICNGYIVTWGGKRLWMAGETEFVPELAELTNIDIAFVAADGVYNMTAGMAADMVRAVNPKVYYPIHYSDLDPKGIARLLEGSGIEVRIRRMK